MGLHLDTIHVSTVSLVGLLKGSAGECRREYMARAPKRKRFKARTGPGNGSRELSPMFVASIERSAANAGGTTFNLEVPGSSPGHAFAAW